MAIQLASLLVDNMGLVAIAVGCAEGNRTTDGGFTESYFGHTDPGNRQRNQGSFSYQHQARTPQEADVFQLVRIRERLLPRFNDAVIKQQTKNHLYLFVTACDVYTQSEAACLAKGGFLDWIPQIKSMAGDNLTEYRVRSYFDPATGQLDTPGFGNKVQRLRADQQRRQKCLTEAIEAWIERENIV
jgi:hypothetical protein